MRNPEQHEYAALLIGKARGDLQVVLALTSATVPDEAVGFHAQQAVEKAVKAVVALAGIEIRHTHGLERLLMLARGAGYEPPAVVAAGSVRGSV